jgi:putative DNA primase/helicase
VEVDYDGEKHVSRETNGKRRPASKPRSEAETKGAIYPQPGCSQTSCDRSEVSVNGLAAALKEVPAPGSADRHANDRATKTPFVPIAMFERNQWVAWKWAERDGKPTKVPVNPKTGGNAAADNPATWNTYEAATRAVKRFNAAGVGFVFTDSDPFSGVDLDDCRNPKTGEIEPWGWEIIRALNSYSEVSPSGKGVKVFLEGKIPGRGRKKKYQTGAVEMYSRARYFTVTGQHVKGTSSVIESRLPEVTALHAKIFGARDRAKPHNLPVEESCGAKYLDDAALIKRALAAKNGGKFRRLWAGKWEGDCASQSEADLALCSLLAFWTGRDPGRIDALFRCSGLMREKWDRADYRESTVSKACEATGGIWEPRRGGANQKGAGRTDSKSSPEDQNAEADDQSRPPEFSDDTLALRFTELHGADLRYTAAWGRWSVWTGTRWQQDQTWYVFDLSRGVCRKSSASCPDMRIAPRIASAVTVAAVERLARADRRHAATVEQWDADPWLLNTPAGVVDLQTGKLRAAAREDYCTKITAVAPHGESPLWRAFLARITDENIELQTFLQVICGYALTGVTREHALFFLYGTGANGKSVFLNTITGVMGNYARTAPIEAFITSTNDRHPTDLAGLQGARLVTAVETEDGRRWAESKLKAVTGGDCIAARFMRQDFFQFTPQFKLCVAGNHKPGLQTVDEAMRRRFHLLPFTVTIPAAERDLELADRLRNEWSGILQWMIDGCLAWQREGLAAPAVVKEATADYLAAEDAIGRWIEDCCITGGKHWTAGASLFANWQQWCEQTGERAGTQKRFTQALQARSIPSERSGAVGTRGFAGIALREDVLTHPTHQPVSAVTRAHA